MVFFIFILWRIRFYFYECVFLFQLFQLKLSNFGFDNLNKINIAKNTVSKFIFCVYI